MIHLYPFEPLERSTHKRTNEKVNNEAIADDVGSQVSKHGDVLHHGPSPKIQNLRTSSQRSRVKSVQTRKQVSSPHATPTSRPHECWHPSREKADRFSRRCRFSPGRLRTTGLARRTPASYAAPRLYSGQTAHEPPVASEFRGSNPCPRFQLDLTLVTQRATPHAS